MKAVTDNKQQIKVENAHSVETLRVVPSSQTMGILQGNLLKKFLKIQPIGFQKFPGNK